MTVKKTSAARLRIVVTIATKFASSLSRLNKRLTKALWKIFASDQADDEKPDKGDQPERRDIMLADTEERMFENLEVHGSVCGGHSRRNLKQKSTAEAVLSRK